MNLFKIKKVKNIIINLAYNNLITILVSYLTLYLIVLFVTPNDKLQSFIYLKLAINNLFLHFYLSILLLLNINKTSYTFNFPKLYLLIPSTYLFCHLSLHVVD
jgi:hypothetical protein